MTTDKLSAEYLRDLADIADAHIGAESLWTSHLRCEAALRDWANDQRASLAQKELGNG